MLPQVLWTIACFSAALVFASFTVRALLCLKWAKRLPAAPIASRDQCSVIVAARDEGERLAQTLQRILAQTGVELEVIAVDDRSRDHTSVILERMAAEDPRVKPMRVDALPEGWLGKCHACHVAAQKATSEWLLFTDADCWMKPNVIARALRVAESEKVEHVTLTPGVLPLTLPARACHIAFLMTGVDWIAAVNRDTPNRHLGIGAFNLVRAETYRAFGGHEALRLSVVDDINLGRLVRKVGSRTRAFISGDDVECHWGVTVRQFIKIMEKNYFAALDYRISLGVLAGVAIPLLWACCVVGPFTGTFVGWVAGGALASNALPALVIARRINWRLLPAFLTPLIFPVLYVTILNSMIRTLWRGGVRWRDTFYPLEMLRKGNVR